MRAGFLFPSKSIWRRSWIALIRLTFAPSAPLLSPTNTSSVYLPLKSTQNISNTRVTVDESVREEDRSDDEEKDEDEENIICQLLDQRMASQRRDKSCAPSH